MAQITEELARLTRDLPREIRQNIETVVEAVETEFGFLKQLGYAIVGIGFPVSELNKYWTTIRLRSDLVKREILISYFPFDDKENPLNVITLSISTFSDIKLSHESSNDEYDDYMDFDLYLEDKSPDLDQSVFEFSHYEGTFAERISKMLHAYAYYIEAIAESIIKGEYWESGHSSDWD